MDVVKRDAVVQFPHAGTWYKYYSNGASIQVNGSSVSQKLVPGKYELYTDVEIAPSVITSADDDDEDFKTDIVLYPNPTSSILFIKNTTRPVDDLVIRSNYGVKFTAERLTEDSWNIRNLSNGLYIVEIKSGNDTVRRKIIKH
jgi:hypothetical protein